MTTASPQTEDVEQQEPTSNTPSPYNSPQARAHPLSEPQLQGHFRRRFMHAEIFRQSLGWGEVADTVAERARQCVPAYQNFLAERCTPAEAPFNALPISDKTSYLLSANYNDLISDNQEEIFTIYSSSGNSGQPFHWPQLKSDYRWASKRMRSFLERTFDIDTRRTMAVVVMGLGSWVGGDYYSWILKNVALETPYQLTIVSPGDRHEDAIHLIHAHGSHYDQIIVMICPSMLCHLRRLAETLGKPLPIAKMRFLVMGETFPETMRLNLQSTASRSEQEPIMLSIYGSADTGALGSESSASVAMRQLLHLEPAVNQALKLGSTLPHLFHFTGSDLYLETSNGELCVTRWQGIPLVRYNLHDQASLLSWSALRAFALEACKPTSQSHGLLRIIEQADEMPDIIAIHGRSDSTLIVGGTNFTEAMLNDALSSPSLATILTGVYRATVIKDETCSALSIEVEFREGITPDQSQLDAIYPIVIKALSRVQPEFGSDWLSVYSRWDHDPSHRALRLSGQPWPALSQQEALRLKARRILKDT